MRICAKCKQEKSLNCFSSNGNGAVKSYCKLCNAQSVKSQRRSNRRTYLLSIWANIRGRCNGYQNKPTYLGFSYPEKLEFVEWAIDREDFNRLFSLWSECGFMQSESPSIDRVDNKKPYVFENMRFITHYENTIKDLEKSYSFCSPDGEIVHVHGLRKFCKQHGLSEQNMGKVFRGERNHHKGWRSANANG